MARTPKRSQDASASDESSVTDEPATLYPAAKKLLDKPMAPNQPPPIKSDVAGGREAEAERQRAVAEAVKDANRDVLPELGGNTWDKEPAEE